MLSQSDINEWRKKANWPTEDQVEQDLLISICLVKIFNHEINVRETLPQEEIVDYPFEVNSEFFSGMETDFEFVTLEAN